MHGRPAVWHCEKATVQVPLVHDRPLQHSRFEVQAPPEARHAVQLPFAPQKYDAQQSAG